MMKPVYREDGTLDFAVMAKDMFEASNQKRKPEGRLDQDTLNCVLQSICDELQQLGVAGFIIALGGDDGYAFGTGFRDQWSRSALTKVTHTRVGMLKSQNVVDMEDAMDPTVNPTIEPND